MNLLHFTVLHVQLSERSKGRNTPKVTQLYQTMAIDFSLLFLLFEVFNKKQVAAKIHGIHLRIRGFGNPHSCISETSKNKMQYCYNLFYSTQAKLLQFNDAFHKSSLLKFFIQLHSFHNLFLGNFTNLQLIYCRFLFTLDFQSRFSEQSFSVQKNFATPEEGRSAKMSNCIMCILFVAQEDNSSLNTRAIC